MNHSVSSFKVYIYKVNPDSWIIRTWKVIRNINRAMVGSWLTYLLSYSFLLGLPTQAFFIYELIRPLWIQPGYPLVPYSGHKP